MEIPNNLKQQKIDFSEIIANYKRHWLWFTISIILCLCLAIFYLYIKRPVYTIQAKVLVSSNETGGMGSSVMKDLPFFGSGSQVDDEIEILNAHSILEDAIKNLKLNVTYAEKTGFMRKKYFYKNSPIEVLTTSSVLDTLSLPLSFKINVDESGKIDIKLQGGFLSTAAEVKQTDFPVIMKTNFGVFSFVKTANFKKGHEYAFRVKIFPVNAMAEDMAENIMLTITSKKSNSINISTESPDIQKSEDLLNEIISLYNERGMNQKNEMAQRTKDFIDERLKVLYGELSKSEGNIQSYKDNNNFIDLGAEAQYQMTKRGQLESAILEKETQYSILCMVRDFLSNFNNRYSLIPFTPEMESGGAINEYNKLILQYIQLSNNAKSNNAVTKALKQQIDALRENVSQSVTKSIQSMGIQLTELKATSGTTKDQLGTMPKKEREFTDLQRNQVVQNNLYSFLLQKREENELVLASSISKGQIVDAAYHSSKPIAPNKAIIVFVGLLFGIVFPILILYIKDLFKTKFNTTDELSKLTSVPLLGEVCHNRHRSSIVVKEGKSSSIVELFRLIRNNIKYMLPSKEDNVLLVTSSISGEGKSFISSNIAASLSLIENHKVVIVGMDIRSPRLAENFNIKKIPGVTSFLSSEDLSVENVIQHTDNSNLDVVVAGPIPPNPSELLLSKRMDELITELKSKYNFVILDSAPVAMVSDTFSLSKFANLVIYVTRANYTNKRLISYFNKLVEDKQLENVAMVLNDTDSKLSYGYGYGYGNEKDND